MGQISKNGQESQSLRWMGWVTSVKMVRSVNMSDGLNGSDWIKGSKESKCQMDWKGHIR